MSVSCHFRNCKALLVTGLMHVSGAIASVQTLTSTFTCRVRARIMELWNTVTDRWCCCWEYTLTDRWSYSDPSRLMPQSTRSPNLSSASCRVTLIFDLLTTNVDRFISLLCIILPPTSLDRRRYRNEKKCYRWMYTNRLFSKVMLFLLWWIKMYIFPSIFGGHLHDVEIHA